MQVKKFPAHEVMLSHIERHVATIREYALNPHLAHQQKLVFTTLELHALHELGAVLKEMELPEKVLAEIDKRFQLIEQSADIAALKVSDPLQHEHLCSFLHELHLELLHPTLAVGEDATFAIQDGDTTLGPSAESGPIKRGGSGPHPFRRD